MFGPAVIVFREVLEAALVVGIVLAATRGIARSRAWISAGAMGGVLASLAVAAGADLIASAFNGVGQEVMNAAILGLAVTMLAWHSAWMQKHGAQIARDMKVVGRDVAAGTRPLQVLALVVALTVLREGSEVVLFLYGIAAGGTDAHALIAGCALGLVAGIAAGAALYFGLRSIPVRRLFSVTTVLIVLLAAGMAAQAAAFLVHAGLLPGLVDPLWDSSARLPTHSAIGQLLHALAGYDDRPSGMQALVFVATLGGIVLLMRVVNGPPAGRWRKAAAMPVLLLGLALAGHAPDARADHVVYSPLVEQGEKAIEFRGHYDFDGEHALDGGQAYKLEFEWSPVSRWLTELVVKYEGDPGASLDATEVASENVFQLTEQGQYWADFGVLAEFAYSLERGGANGIELALLGQKDFLRNEVRANLIFERPLENGADLELSYSWQYRYRLTEHFEPGVEMYGSAGTWGSMGSFSSNEQQFGPAAFGKLRTARGALKYEAGLLFGLTSVTPDTTVRFLLEYEF